MAPGLALCAATYLLPASSCRQSLAVILKARNGRQLQGSHVGRVWDMPSPRVLGLLSTHSCYITRLPSNLCFSCLPSARMMTRWVCYHTWLSICWWRKRSKGQKQKQQAKGCCESTTGDSDRSQAQGFAQYLTQASNWLSAVIFCYDFNCNTHQFTWNILFIYFNFVYVVLRTKLRSWVVVVPVFDPSTLEADLCDLEVSLVYTMSSRTIGLHSQSYPELPCVAPEKLTLATFRRIWTA